jgi:hypothetical protein
MIHDPLCQLGVPCRSTEDGQHWEITRAAGMELNVPICEACVDWCDCLRVQAIRQAGREEAALALDAEPAHGYAFVDFTKPAGARVEVDWLMKPFAVAIARGGPLPDNLLGLNGVRAHDED